LFLTLQTGLRKEWFQAMYRFNGSLTSADEKQSNIPIIRPPWSALRSRFSINTKER